VYCEYGAFALIVQKLCIWLLNKNGGLSNPTLRSDCTLYANRQARFEKKKNVPMGVSKFSKMRAYCALNNLNDVFIVLRFADICGITEDDYVEQYVHDDRQLTLLGINFSSATKGVNDRKRNRRQLDLLSPVSFLLKEQLSLRAENVSFIKQGAFSCYKEKPSLLGEKFLFANGACSFRPASLFHHNLAHSAVAHLHDVYAALCAVQFLSVNGVAAFHFRLVCILNTLYC